MKTVAIIGGGPSGLMAAEVLSAQGFAVTVFEAMPTVGRKFLLAGKSGLNLSHANHTKSYGPDTMRPPNF
jgi:predicted flavoprotein YhiN